MAAYTKEQLETYDKWKMDILTERSMIDDAETRGLEKGEAIGLEKGEAIGEAKNQKKTVIAAYQAGVSIDVIANFTGLTHEQINAILKESI